MMPSGEFRNALRREPIEALIQAEEGKALLEGIHRKADILPRIGEVPSYTRDLRDDRFVACALIGNTEYVISVDKDLLNLGTFQDVRVMTSYEFSNRLNSEV